jgi:hypothetical protein
MPSYSFYREWIDPLLRCEIQQTTRPQTDRFHIGVHIGDTGYIYIEQRRRIIDKPLRTPTPAGEEFIFRMIEDEGRYPQPELHPRGGYSVDPYYAHFLGTVKITEVYDLYPYNTPLDELGEWAHADGFDTFETADVWFTKQYDEEWDLRHWTVIRWQGWLERYFEPEEITDE